MSRARGAAKPKVDAGYEVDPRLFHVSQYTPSIQLLSIAMCPTRYLSPGYRSRPNKTSSRPLSAHRVTTRDEKTKTRPDAVCGSSSHALPHFLSEHACIHTYTPRSRPRSRCLSTTGLCSASSTNPCWAPPSSSSWERLSARPLRLACS